jgi:L-seryl-tRNA(Ser) seleniumtransferase
MSEQEAPARPPSVDALARDLAGSHALPHALLIDAARSAIAAGGSRASIHGRAEQEATAIDRALLQRIVNATGVLLHTNLGRAPLGHQQAPTYTNLELDLDTGHRGSRSAHAAALLARAAGAEAAMVTNNGAGAVLLVLAALARHRDVVVSRGELVEIGGGFRIPEVVATSGCRMTEVGTTNRTRVADYTAALDDPTTDVAVVLKVHPSNYRISGFTESAAAADLASLGPPLVVDLGSGLLDANCPWLPGGPPAWRAGEPAVRQTLAAGAAAVTFSGDKLLGGPQAGIIAGRADIVDACARHPLARALRPGALVLAALQEVALTYLRRDAARLPFWRLATVPADQLRERARAIVERAGKGSVVDSEAVSGGGTLPNRTIASAAVALAGDHASALRAESPPVIARRAGGLTLLDLRAVDEADDPLLVAALRNLNSEVADR